MATHSFWVIVAGQTPTAFRARRREDLLPTLKQLQRAHPDTELRWFERGQLWESPDAAEKALLEQRRQRPTRGPGWRPGGAHADPRARFQKTRDEKRARFKRRLSAKRKPTGHAPRERRPGRGRKT